MSTGADASNAPAGEGAAGRPASFDVPEPRAAVEVDPHHDESIAPLRGDARAAAPAPASAALEDGPPVDGPAVDGPAVDGPAVDGPAVEESVQEGPGAPTPAPTGPVLTTTQELLVRWSPPPEPEPRRGLAGWALASSILGLLVSLVVGWGFPIGLVGVIAAAMALRRPTESRSAAGWALALGILSLAYSAVWLSWAASRSNLFG